MAIVIYKCDTCDREIELVRNERGLETVGRCIITEGCRGKLYQVDLKADYIRGNFPDSVSGLTDWSQRKVLYNHRQTIASNSWLVEHDLGVNPLVQVFIEVQTSATTTEYQEIIPTSITIIDPNNLRINFDRSYSGLAQCIARTSKPTTTTEVAAVTTADTIQISTNSEVTIATLNSAATVDLVIEFTTPSGVVVPITYTLDDVPAITSPWSDVNEVYVNRKTYTVRSFNLVTAEMTGGTVTSGSSFYFKQLYTTGDMSPPASIGSGQAIMLLANSPYEVYDKIYNQFIDISTVGAAQASTSFYYDEGEFYGATTLPTTTYPYITSV